MRQRQRWPGTCTRAVGRVCWPCATQTSNIVLSNGLLDPWSAFGVLEDVSDTVVAVVIPNVSASSNLSALGRACWVPSHTRLLWKGARKREAAQAPLVASGRCAQGAHHVDLMFSHPGDTPDIKQARVVELQHIRRWTAEHEAALGRRRRGGSARSAAH